MDCLPPIDIHVKPTAVEPLRRGHPWLYREQIARAPNAPTPPGAEARLIARKPSSEFERLLGYSAEPEMIHRDNLVLA